MACVRRRYTNRKSVSACRDEPPWSEFVHAGKRRNRTEALMTLAQSAAFKRDNWSPCGPGRRSLGHFDRRFRHLLGNSEQMFAPLHFAPNVVRPHPRRRPQNREIVEEVGTLA